ncbi:alpha,alpha-trehalose-phosphate synthase (UDP-forming) [Methylosinus sp. H3A]|uniref:alpha,alpha-trehalose-phosphate synthase (UDP-forming) n=1 Tax=Methylosinus sp. H3A TaxID=2785786 RepID=UPI0018C1F7C6|nr:alpha,alpha-trehalose-phosphate synthase (UDP-forming) [Methylosinus sp. H3A]MBG0809771.1 alpha,alpha-trehalose-phosphate synthase (UDP-forming) [Methylosinus sp. H3A]
MKRLVVVSNRVADPGCSQAAGGLAVCILDALRKRGGMWFGWNGEIVADDAEIDVSCVKFDELTLATMPLSERDYRDYYLGFANAALWPVHHCRLDLARFAQEAIDGYRRVNDRFAEKLAPMLRSNDLVWVHDYHFIPLGAGLRERGVSNRIGFFLHIPFPPPDVLVAMPEHEWLMNALVEYDLIGFQTKADQANFFRFMCDFMQGEMLTPDLVRVGGKTVTASVFPVGIDVDSFAAMAESPSAAKRIQRLHRAGEPRINVIGVDRLDYTKGLPDRLRSFKRLLEIYPQNCKAVTLMQIAPPTREDVQAYADIRHELEALSGEINGQFGDFDWTPVRYLHRRVDRDTLAALYRGSQVGLVTPLRDGMNLVAKEYVVAQDAENPGVLVLSRFAGAAEELQEALIVNPYDADEVANAMQKAIVMPLAERKERHAALLTRVRKHDSFNWMDGFLRALSACRMPLAA